MKNSEKSAIKVIVPLKRKTLGLKLGLVRKKRTFFIHEFTMDVCRKIAALKLNNKLSYQDKANAIIALAVHNFESEPSKKLINWLDRNLTSKEVAVIMGHVDTQFNGTAFVKSMILTKGLNVLNVPD